MLTFTIADTDICWHRREFTPQMGRFSPLFLKNTAPTGDALRFSGIIDSLEAFDRASIVRDAPDFQVLTCNGSCYYLYNPSFPKDRFVVPYGNMSEAEENQILFSDGFLDVSRISFDKLLGVCGLHKLLLQRQKGIFHAAYIDVGGEAVIFAGPSGMGKSTQAELWEKHAGAQIINGDRVAIGLKNGRFHAYGYPACGSSGICINRTLPIRAIVVLEQGESNAVVDMTLGEKFRACLSGLTINNWEAEETQLAMDLAEKWVASIPIHRFSCRPDANAVYVLKAFLQG